MTNIEYFLYALKNELIYKQKWFYSVMTLQSKLVQHNEYLKVVDKEYYVLVNNEYLKITNVTSERPLLMMNDKLVISSLYFKNLLLDVDTTIGRAIANKILLSDNFGNTIPYINNRINIRDIETLIAKNMNNVDTIKVPDYINFVNACSFIQGLSRITTISATEKSMLPPPGITAYKKTLAAEYTEKYGISWTKDRSKIVEFENALKAMDNEWLKGDPSDGFLISGKVKDTARTKMYLMFGAEAGFDKKGVDINLVDKSLLDGYPEDVDKLTTMFNTSRSGSYDRGKETQKGGAAAKDTLRATSAVTVVDGDCGATIGKLINVTKDISDSLLGRYIINNKVATPIKEPNLLIGKIIEIRSPSYCKTSGSSICSVCVGEVMSDYKTGISLLVTEISGILLANSMKSMHTSKVSIMTFDIKDVIK